MTYVKQMLLVAVCVLSTSACNTVEGLGEDLQSLGDTIEREANEKR